MQGAIQAFAPCMPTLKTGSLKHRRINSSATVIKSKDSDFEYLRYRPLYHVIGFRQPGCYVHSYGF